MADLIVGVDPVSININFDLRADRTSPTFLSPEVFADLYPYRMNVVTLDPYRTLQGWPVEAPIIDIYTRTLASATGHVIEQRPTPYDVATSASVRWIADEQSWDSEGNAWRSSGGAYINSYFWETTPEFSPTFLPEMSYFVGKELFIRGAINFDATNREHMWSSFHGSFEGVTGYSVLMVMIPQSSFGNTEGRDFTGLWSPGKPTPPEMDTFDEDVDGFSARIDKGKLIIDSEESQNITGLDAADVLAAAYPVYVGLSFGYPTATGYLAFGPNNIKSFTFPTSTVSYAQTMEIALGRSKGSLLNTADMAILDMGLYDAPLTQSQMLEEIAILSASYGG